MVDLKKIGSSLEELLNRMVLLLFEELWRIWFCACFFFETNSATCCVLIMMIREGRSSADSKGTPDGVLFQ